MRALRFERFGEPSEVLTLADLESQELPPGHARVRLALRPINPADLLTIRGHYGALPELPAVPGREGVGTTVELDGASEGLKVGDRVVVFDRIGTWQEEIVVEPRCLIAVPARVSDEAAAQAFLNPLSAWAMLDELKITTGEWLLQSAAASALGKLVIQMAATQGLRSINIVRRPEQGEQLRTLGADEVVVWPAGGRRLADLVREITGSDISYALDAVGGKLGGEMVNCLAPGGVMLVHGSLAHPETMPISSGRFLTRSLTLRGFWLNEWLARTSLDEQREALRLVLDQMAADKLRPPAVEATYDLAAFQDAMSHAERSRDGKIMLSG